MLKRSLSDAVAVRFFMPSAALRPYVSAMCRATARRALTVRESHAVRLECAERTLAPDSLREYGASRLLDEARDATARLVHPSLMQWLPEFGTGIILPPG